MRSLATALILMLAAIPHSSSAAGRVFFEDFESYNVGTLPATQWQQDLPHNLLQVVTSSVDGRAGPHSGTKMGMGNWDGNANDFTTAKLSSWSYTREFLIRLWVRYDADVDHVTGNKAFRLDNFQSPPAESYYFDGQVESQPTAPMFSFWEVVAGKTITGSPYENFNGGPLGDTKWHKIEIYVKHNTVGQKDGILRVWNDGNLVHDITGIQSVTDGNKWYPMYLMSNWSNFAHDANNHAYWDDIEIFSDTGTGGTGNMFDATICDGPTCKPPKPLNLRVQ